MNATGILSNRFVYAYLRLPGKLRVPLPCARAILLFFSGGTMSKDDM